MFFVVILCAFVDPFCHPSRWRNFGIRLSTTGDDWQDCFIIHRDNTHFLRPVQASHVKRSGLARFGRVRKTQQIRKISILVRFTQRITQV